MKIKTVLFDLDGTLLPMDQELFIKAYFGALIEMLAKLGYDAKKMAKAMMKSIEAMMINCGEKSNESVFWDTFLSSSDTEFDKLMPHFEKFYENDFDKIKVTAGYNEKSAYIIEKLKKKGIKTVLATQPLFPCAATYKRIAWAGLSHNDFDLVTTYENSSFAKPKLEYYNEILEKLGVAAEECLMVGNDVDDDMVAKELGMQVFLLCDCLINKNNVDISIYPNGGFADLEKYIDENF